MPVLLPSYVSQDSSSVLGCDCASHPLRGLDSRWLVFIAIYCDSIYLAGFDFIFAYGLISCVLDCVLLRLSELGWGRLSFNVVFRGHGLAWVTVARRGWTRLW